MTPTQLSALLLELVALPDETEWVEFKENFADSEMIGKRISGLANAAALNGRLAGYLVWGVEDGTHKIKGTSFKPEKEKVGGQALISWLVHLTTPKVELSSNLVAEVG